MVSAPTQGRGSLVRSLADKGDGMCLGIPGRVVETYQEHDVLMAKVDFGGVARRACLEHVPEARPGDYVLIHVGFALVAHRRGRGPTCLRCLKEMQQLDELGDGDVLS